ncbi:MULTISPECIES: hypothetical protein [unclassified Nonomuraea]|uniref:hypothetical protein n=1 Tax=unclassified Nonomuraea TaxID=2593643 RepID=UPI0033E47E4D
MKVNQAVLVLGLLFSINVISGCSACDVSHGPAVVLPKANAAADVVVRAYLAAISARDDKAVIALSAPEFYESIHRWPNDPVDTWANVQVADVGKPKPDTSERDDYRQVQVVDVDIEVRRCDEEPPDDDPHYPYTFMVGRQSGADPWKIISFGGLG